MTSERIRTALDEFWARCVEVWNATNGQVEPQEYVTLKTKVVRWALGVTLLQSIFLAIVWCIDNRVLWPLLIPGTTFLQIGWFWNKVTEAWRVAGEGGHYGRVPTEEPYHPPQPVIPTYVSSRETSRIARNSSLREEFGLTSVNADPLTSDTVYHSASEGNL